MSATEDPDAWARRFNRCDAPLPSEPGPMCARERGHEGEHRSTSGLWQWDDPPPDGPVDPEYA